MGNNSGKKKLPGTVTGHKCDYFIYVRIGDVIGRKKRLYLVVESQKNGHVGIAELTPELLASHFPPTCNLKWTHVCHYGSVASCFNKISWNERHTELCNLYKDILL